MSAWNDPWSTGFDWGTVEADPDLSAALQERTDQRDEALRRVVQLEARQEKVRALHTQFADEHGGFCDRCAQQWPCPTMAALDPDLVGE